MPDPSPRSSPVSAAAWVTAAIAVASLAQTPPTPEPQAGTGFDSATYASQRPEAPSAAAAAQIAVVRDGGRIDVNRADAVTLQLLPGVGPVVSQRIVQDRAEHGPYPTLEAMTRVSGIGPRTIERIAALAYAGSGADAGNPGAPSGR